MKWIILKTKFELDGCILAGLVVQKSGCIDFNLLLAHLKKAWTEKNKRNLIAFIKLATIVSNTFHCFPSLIVGENPASYVILALRAVNGLSIVYWTAVAVLIYTVKNP